MGRSPCCDKVGLKKGPWTSEEDQKLLAFIQEHGHGSWRSLPSKAGLQRCGKSCRLRWINYLRPDIKRGKFTVQEEQTIIQLHALLGNRWSAIATHLSKRTDNEIKNYWNTNLKKRLVAKGIDPVSHKPKNNTLLFNNGHLKSKANLTHMAQWESARLEAEARLVKQSKLQSMNPLSNQVNSVMCSLTSPSTLPRKSLDKVWSGILGHTPSDETNRNENGDVESTTSTISTTKLEDNCNNLHDSVVGVHKSLGSWSGNITRQECVEKCEYKDHVNGTQSTSPIVNNLIMPTIDGAWTIEQLKSSNSNNEFVPSGNFLETFTDLLLCSSNSSDHINSLTGDYSLGIGNNGDNGPSESIKDCHEDKNKNYWDTILNMVNSSTSNSLMF